MIAGVADSIAAHMANRRDSSDAGRQEEDRDPVIEQVAQRIMAYAGRSKLIEFRWIEKHSNALKRVDFIYEKEFRPFSRRFSFSSMKIMNSFSDHLEFNNCILELRFNADPPA
jgi:hypothetical protein